MHVIDNMVARTSKRGDSNIDMPKSFTIMRKCFLKASTQSQVHSSNKKKAE